MDDEHLFNEQMERFLTHKAHENYCIKFHTTDYNVSTYFNNIMTSILSHKSTGFNYYMMLENILKNASSRINKYNLLQFLQNPKDLDFVKTPVLFIGAGPSLSDNINWLKENKDKFIIVSIAAANKILKANGIIPDIVTTLDPQYKILKNKQFDKDSIDFIKDTFVIASINTDQRFLDKFNQEKLFLYEMNRSFHSSTICYKGFSVGEMSASILLGLKFETIYFLGLDFAINQKTGETHANGYGEKSYNKIKNDSEKDSFTLDKELIEIKGNAQEKVFTNRLFNMSLDAMSSNISTCKLDYQKIYNLSNQGGFIYGTIPLSVNNVDLKSFQSLDKELLKNKLKTFLLDFSKNKLSYQDKINLERELEYVRELIEYIELLKLDFSKTFEEFDSRIEELVQRFFFPKVYCNFLLTVFIHFFNVVLQYIYYCLNLENLSEENLKIEKVGNLFLEDLARLLEIYENCLEKVENQISE